MLSSNKRSDQVKELLLNYIEQQQVAQGDKLPSEAEIAKLIGVSRNTIRETYIALESEGIIVRRHGVGTFVVRTPVIKESLMTDMTGLFSKIKTSGYKASLRALSVDYTLAPPEVVQAFDVFPSKSLLCVKRVLVADATPAVYLIDYFHSNDKLDNYDWDHFDGNMINLISELLEIGDIHFQSRFLAIIPDSELTEYLDLTKGQPIIKVLSTITAPNNHSIGYSIAYFNPTVVELTTTRIIRRA